jgi:hypothetical protein
MEHLVIRNRPRCRGSHSLVGESQIWERRSVGVRQGGFMQDT